jgi:hypothetical protein
MLKNRAPYDAEVDAEVAKEYQRIQDAKRKVRPDPSSEIEAIRTRVTDLEASQKRMEDMMRLFLQNQSQKHPSHIDSMTEPSSSAKMPAFSVLTSTTEELMMVAQKQAEDVEEGHPEISGNADVPEDIASLEQVTSSKTHPY